MQYIALQELNTESGIKQPGDLVPEAAGWDMCWFTTGHVAAYPDEMVDEVRNKLHTGHLQMHGQQFGQQFVGGAMSQVAQGAADLLVVRDPEPAPSPGVPAPPIAAAATDPAAPPLPDPAIALSATDLAAGEEAALDDAGSDDAAPAAGDPTTPDRPRGRMGRRRSK